MDRGGSVAYPLLISGMLQQNVLRTCLVPGVFNTMGAVIPCMRIHRVDIGHCAFVSGTINFVPCMK